MVGGIVSWRDNADAGNICADKMENYDEKEFLPTSVYRDGTNIGYDLPLTKSICDAVSTPGKCPQRRLCFPAYPGSFHSSLGRGCLDS